MPGTLPLVALFTGTDGGVVGHHICLKMASSSRLKFFWPTAVGISRWVLWTNYQSIGDHQFPIGTWVTWVLGLESPIGGAWHVAKATQGLLPFTSGEMAVTKQSEGWKIFGSNYWMRGLLGCWDTYGYIWIHHNYYTINHMDTYGYIWDIGILTT